MNDRRCLICTEATVFCCQLKDTTSKYSECNIRVLLETIFGDNWHTDEKLDDEMVCQNCLMKIDEYDLATQTSKKLEAELKHLYYTNIVKDEVETTLKVADGEFEFSEEYLLVDEEEIIGPKDELKEQFITQDGFEILVMPAENDSNPENPASPSPPKPKLPKKNQKVGEPKKRVKSQNASRAFKTTAVGKDDEETQHMCDVCGATFTGRQTLQQHIKSTHEQKKIHSCSICEKTFTQRGALVRHYPIHTGIKPFQCEKCGKQFLHYSSFHMHELAHNDIREKKCDICGLALRSTSHLNRHMRIHSGEKPFSCPICGQKFAQRYNMTTHYKVHQGIHRNRNYKCLVCSSIFQRKTKYDEHMQTVHQMMNVKLELDKKSELDLQLSLL